MCDGWSEAKIESMKAMWANGFSASSIACDIDMSRDAVLGKIARLGLNREPSIAIEDKPAKGRIYVEGEPMSWTDDVLTEKRVPRTIRQVFDRSAINAYITSGGGEAARKQMLAGLRA